MRYKWESHRNVNHVNRYICTTTIHSGLRCFQCRSRKLGKGKDFCNGECNRRRKARAPQQGCILEVHVVYVARHGWLQRSLLTPGYVCMSLNQGETRLTTRIQVMEGSIAISLQKLTRNKLVGWLSVVSSPCSSHHITAHEGIHERCISFFALSIHLQLNDHIQCAWSVIIRINIRHPSFEP